MKRLGLLAVTFAAAACSIGASGRTTPSSLATPACDGDLEWRAYRLVHVQDVVSDTGAAAQAWRDTLRLPSGRAEDVVPVVSDSLCARAGALMRVRERLASAATPQAFLFRVGSSRYWAESRTLESDGKMIVFIMDSTLSQVLRTVVD